MAVQYIYWLKNAVRGDFGTAYIINRPVIQLIFERIPATLILMGTSIFLTLLIAIPLGIFSAVKKNRAFDHIVTLLSFVGMSTPSFWLALMLMLFFSLYLGILPSTGMYDPMIKDSSLFVRFSDLARHLILPALTMTIVSIAGITRFVRSSMIEVLGQNYIKTARAKGLPENTILFKHALKNAMLPLITLFGMIIPELFAGAFIIETVYAWPGMGRLGVTAIFSRNYPVIMGVVVFSSLLIVLGNLIADIMYSYADPRIRISKS